MNIGMLNERRYGAIFLSIGLAVLLGGCTVPSALFTEEFDQIYDVAEGTVLKVYNRNGAITVTTWDGNQVSVYALKKSNYGKSELKEARIEVKTGKQLVVETKHEERNVRASVDYEIKVPKGLIVENLETSNGGISLVGTAGNTSLRASNGAITIDDVDGYVRAATSNARIDIKDTMGVLDVSTSNGQIVVEVPVLIRDTEIETSNAGIRIYLANDLDADVRAHTSNGRIRVHDVQLSIKQISETSLEGTLGDGEYELIIQTSNANIDLYEMS